MTARNKRTAVIVGACIAAAILVYLAIALVLPVRERMLREVALKKEKLGYQREILNREATYKTRVAQISGRLETYTTRLLPGDNPNVAGAELQRILKEFADQSGVEITQKNILQEKKTQDLLTRISVKIDTKCDLDQLVQLIMAIENYEKYLKIDDCTISGFRMQRRFEIRPSLTVSGYISTREGKS